MPAAAHLLLLRGATVDHHGAHARLVGELARLVVDLHEKKMEGD